MTSIIILLSAIYATFVGYVNNNGEYNNIASNMQNKYIGVDSNIDSQTNTYLDLSNIPEFDGENYTIEINNNIPYFTEEDFRSRSI